MKNQSFRRRLGFAAQGIRSAWLRESSFRLQCVAALCVLLALLWFRPAMLWWALLLLNFNTALEHALDHLSPERHPAIEIAKDCSAGAVLLLSLTASGSFIAFLIAQWGPG
jgi:undecaprenol kinase